ncbi:MAG: hypothetical protein M0P13_12540, partial [Fibrobacteraceae bacterium]|nr:hypothetical protein [Fibrobacteraceae bacterium]
SGIIRSKEQKLLAIYANPEEMDQGSLDAIDGVIAALESVENLDFEARYVGSEKELTNFVNEGKKTAVLTHNLGESDEFSYSSLKESNRETKYRDFNNSLKNGHTAKMFSCNSARGPSFDKVSQMKNESWRVGKKNGTLLDYNQNVNLGESAKDAATYLLLNSKSK